MLRAESLPRRLGHPSGWALAPDLCTSNGRPTITSKKYKYIFLPVLLMATKIAKVSKLSQVKETIPADVDRFLLAHLRADAAHAAVSPAFAPLEWRGCRRCTPSGESRLSFQQPM